MFQHKTSRKQPNNRRLLFESFFAQKAFTGLLSLFVFLLLITGMFNNLKGQNLDSVRHDYFGMDERNCAWEDMISKVSNSVNPLMMAYEGASLAASAQCQKGAMKKLKRFREGKEKLEKAVNLMPESTEVRFLRYTVKVKSPDILNYKDKGMDENFILQRLSSGYKDMDEFLLEEMCSFLLKHADLSEDDKKMVQKIYQI